MRRFALIALAYGTLVCLYAVLTPPWEAPDEPAHYLYIAQLASRWRPPPESPVRQTTRIASDGAYVSSNYEWYQPPLGYLPAALVYRAIDFVAPESLPRRIPPLDPRHSTDPTVRRLFFSEHAHPLGQWRGHLGLLALRITSAAWGLVVIAAAVCVGGLLDSKGGWLGVVCGGCVAFLPQFAFVSATVRSDTVANAVAAAFMATAAVLVVRPERRHACALALGGLLGLGLLSKSTFVSMVPLALMVAMLVGVRAKASLETIAMILGPALAVWGAYHLSFEEARRALRYTHSTVLMIKAEALTWESIARLPRPLFIDLFYARFGWANVTVPNGWTGLGFAFWATGATVTAWRCVKRPGDLQERRSREVILLCAAALGLAFAGVLRFNLAQFQPQGRLLFPVLVPWAVVGLWGCWQVASPRGRMIIGIGALGFLLIFNLYALCFALWPAYHD